MHSLIRAIVVGCLAGATFAAASSTAIRDAVAPFIADGEISGAVTLVASEGRITHLEAQGVSDLSTGREMQPDDLFWIASMTKPLAAVSIMMLQEEGRLDIHDEVATHLPEFKDQWLEVTRSPDAMSLKRPARPITIFDLLTHTSGVPNVVQPRVHTTLAEVVVQASQQPLQFEPGSRWKYTTTGTDIVGRIVEVVSGQPYEDFVQARILDPLKMSETTFFPTQEDMERVARSYQKSAETGELEEIQSRLIVGDIWDDQRLVVPGAGLFSTAEDLFRFYQMMLNGGVWQNVRLLSETSVQELTRTQSGDLETGFSPGMSWGLKFQVVREPQGVTAMLTPGTFGHGGAHATQSWADPSRETIYILMIQRQGLQPSGDRSAIRAAFQQAAVDSLP